MATKITMTVTIKGKGINEKRQVTFTDPKLIRDYGALLSKQVKHRHEYKKKGSTIEATTLN